MEDDHREDFKGRDRKYWVAHKEERAEYKRNLKLTVISHYRKNGQAKCVGWNGNGCPFNCFYRIKEKRVEIADLLFRKSVACA